MYVESNLCAWFLMCVPLLVSIVLGVNLISYITKTKQKFSTLIGYELGNQQEEIASY